MSKYIKKEVMEKEGLYIIEVKNEAFEVRGNSYGDKLRNAVRGFLGSGNPKGTFGSPNPRGPKIST
jgi:hypothetical protein